MFSYAHQSTIRKAINAHYSVRGPEACVEHLERLQKTITHFTRNRVTQLSGREVEAFVTSIEPALDAFPQVSIRNDRDQQVLALPFLYAVSDTRGKQTEYVLLPQQKDTLPYAEYADVLVNAPAQRQYRTIFFL